MHSRDGNILDYSRPWSISSWWVKGVWMVGSRRSWTEGTHWILKLIDSLYVLQKFSHLDLYRYPLRVFLLITGSSPSLMSSIRWFPWRRCCLVTTNWTRWTHAVWSSWFICQRWIFQTMTCWKSPLNWACVPASGMKHTWAKNKTLHTVLNLLPACVSVELIYCSTPSAAVTSVFDVGQWQWWNPALSVWCPLQSLVQS